MMPISVDDVAEGEATVMPQTVGDNRTVCGRRIENFYRHSRRNSSR
jgi:hypothetical protein